MRVQCLIALALVLCRANAASAQDTSSYITPTRTFGSDHTLGVGMARDANSHSFAGFRATSAFNRTESVALIGEVEWLWAIAERAPSGRRIRDSQALALAGIRLRKFVESPAVPYFQLSGGYAGRRDNALDTRRSIVAVRSEVGLDMAISRHLGVRAGGGWTVLFADVPYRHQFAGTIAITLSLGQR